MFRLRWAFYFPDRQKYGTWNWVEAKDPLSNPNLMDQTGLVSAQVHRQEIGGNGEIKSICGCDGESFKEFQFIVQKYARSGFISIVGIALKTKTESVVCYIDGTVK